LYHKAAHYLYSPTSLGKDKVTLLLKAKNIYAAYYVGMMD
jgi:hypothetical protein